MGDFRPKRFGESGKRVVRSFAAEAAEAAPAGVDATDAARAYAGEHNIDLATVTGTGTDGRITKDDVVAAHTGTGTVPADEAGGEEPSAATAG